MVSQFSSDDARKDFSKSVYSRMSFFFSILPISYANNPTSLNKYLEAMNSGGKGLEQHEILKVELMHDVDNIEYLTRIWNAVCDLNRPVIKRDEKIQEEFASASTCKGDEPAPQWREEARHGGQPLERLPECAADGILHGRVVKEPPCADEPPERYVADIPARVGPGFRRLAEAQAALNYLRKIAASAKDKLL